MLKQRAQKRALVLLLKEQEMNCPFYNLRGCLVKQIVLFYCAVDAVCNGAE